MEGGDPLANPPPEGSVQIDISQVPVIRDLTIQEGVLQARLTLLPGARTRTGTPLTYEHGGWRPIREGESGLFFAAGAAENEPVLAFKAMIVETHVRNLIVGPVKIVDLLAPGPHQFVNDPAGPYVALTPSRVLLG